MFYPTTRLSSAPQQTAVSGSAAVATSAGIALSFHPYAGGDAATLRSGMTDIMPLIDPDIAGPLQAFLDLVRRSTPSRAEAAAHLPRGTLADRLHARREAMIRATFEGALRTAAAGHRTDVVLTDEPSAVGFVACHDGAWVPTQDNRLTWVRTATTFTITVSRLWQSRVQARGLAVVDGCPTLDAEPIDLLRRDIEVFAARWVVRRRSFAATLADGYIARAGAIACHADSLSGAIARLRRKRRAAAHALEQGLSSPVQRRRDRTRQVPQPSHPMTILFGAATGFLSQGESHRDATASGVGILRRLAAPLPAPQPDSE